MRKEVRMKRKELNEAMKQCHRQCMARIERMNKLRLHIMATMGPGATSIDVEIELAQRMQEEE